MLSLGYAIATTTRLFSGIRFAATVRFSEKTVKAIEDAAKQRGPSQGRANNIESLFSRTHEHGWSMQGRVHIEAPATILTNPVFGRPTAKSA
jgi:hypothetical protein